MDNIKLPDAPAEYDRQQMQRLITDIETALTRPVNAANVFALNLPTSPVGLRPSQLYIDNGVLMVVPS